MPTYRCEALHVANVVCVVEATSLEDAVQKFKRGQYDEFFNEKNDEAIECDVATVKLDIAIEVPK